MAARDLAVIDVDGVLADVRHRLPYLRRRPSDWKAFFAAAPTDPVLPEGLAVARRLAEECDLVYLTGRPESCRADTLAWFAEHGVPPGRLVMRPPRDFRPARVVKPAMLRELAEDVAISVVVDDDEAVCQALEAAGFTVLRADWMPDDEGDRDDGGDGGDQATLFTAQERDGRT